MALSQNTVVQGSGRRRLYVLVTVALATFVVSITLMGLICHGFAGPQPTKVSSTKPPLTRADAATVLAAAEKEFNSLQLAVQQSQLEVEAVQAELTEFLAAHFANLSESSPAPADLDRRPSEAATPSPAESAHQPKQIVNPRWQELHVKIAELNRRRTELLTTLLPTHPVVRAVELSLADAEAQLKTIPAVIPAPSNASLDGDLQPPSTVATKSQEIHQKEPSVARFSEDQARFHELTDRANAALQKYRAAQAHTDDARQRYATSTANCVAAMTASQNPRSRLNPRFAIYLCSLLAIAAGLIVARQALVSETAFHSAAEVRQVLGLPILGFLPRVPHQPPLEQPLSEARWVGRSVLVSEVCLAAVVVLLAVTSVLDKQFFRDFVVDPLAACSQKFWC